MRKLNLARILCFPLDILFRGDFVSKSRKANTTEDLRLNPQLRLCAKFDATSIAEFPVSSRDDMGVRVVDNCAEEHIM